MALSWDKTVIFRPKNSTQKYKTLIYTHLQNIEKCPYFRTDVSLLRDVGTVEALFLTLYFTN